MTDIRITSTTATPIVSSASSVPASPTSGFWPILVPVVTFWWNRQFATESGSPASTATVVARLRGLEAAGAARQTDRAAHSPDEAGDVAAAPHADRDPVEDTLARARAQSKRVDFAAPTIRAVITTLQAGISARVTAFNAEPANQVDIAATATYRFGIADDHAAVLSPQVEVAAVEGGVGSASGTSTGRRDALA